MTGSIEPANAGARAKLRTERQVLGPVKVLRSHRPRYVRLTVDFIKMNDKVEDLEFVLQDAKAIQEA